MNRLEKRARRRGVERIGDFLRKRMRDVSGFVALVAVALATCPMRLVAQVPVGLPQLSPGGMTATASCTYTTYVPARAIDGNTTTDWEIRTALPQWIQLDLGARHTLGAVEIYSGTARQIKGYRVYVSDEPAPSPWDVPVAEGEAPNTAGWHHASRTLACDGQLLFTHHGRRMLADPAGEIDKARRTLGNRVVAAFDGLVMEL